MSKVIRVTSVLAIVGNVLGFFFGKMIIPILALLISGGNDLIYGSVGATSSFVIFGVSVVVSFIGLLFFVAYGITMAVTANSMRESIGLEVSGFILFGIVGPIFSMLGMFSIYFVNMLGYPARIMMIISSMRTVGLMFSPLDIISIGLLFIAFSFSICRKKYAVIQVSPEYEADEE